MGNLSLNIIELLEPGIELWPNDWQVEFGPYKWFYLEGLKELHEDTETNPLKHGDFLDLLKNPLELIPESWSDLCPSCSWDRNQLALQQVKNAISPHKKKTNALTFDTACFVAAVYHHFYSNKRIEENPLEKLKIRPAFFRLPKFSRDLYKNYFHHENQDSLNAQFGYTGQKSDTFFQELVEGFPATYKTLQRISEYLEKCDNIEFKSHIISISSRSWLHREDVENDTILSSLPDKEKAKKEKRPAQREIIVRDEN